MKTLGKKISDSLPDSCSEYDCLILVQQSNADVILPEDLRVQRNPANVVNADDESGVYSPFCSWYREALHGQAHFGANP